MLSSAFPRTQFLLFFIASLILSACGGGGGGGSDDPELRVSESNVAFNADEDDSTHASRTITVTVTNQDKISGSLYVGIFHTNTAISTVEYDLRFDPVPIIIYPRSPSSLVPGTYEDEIDILVCYDPNCDRHLSGSPRTINVSYTVNALPDADNDGVPDSQDAFPNDPTETIDTDNDGIGNNADNDDDNDGVNDNVDAFPLDPTESSDSDGDSVGDNADAFPLDPTETVDTDNDGVGDNSDVFPNDATEASDNDGDGIGDNADNNDDNDRLLDIDDPRPLDANAPGEIYTVSPGIVIVGESTRVIVSGSYFSDEDSFFVNDIETTATVLSDSAVELNIENPPEGELAISIQYDNHSYLSMGTVDAINPVYFPYAVASVGGNKPKGYFDPLNQRLYVHNSTLSSVSRFEYRSGGAWQEDSIALGGINSIGLSPDLGHLYVLRAGNIVEINQNDFSANDVTFLSPDFNTVLTDFEFDYSNKAVIVSDYQGSGSTNVYSFDLEPSSETFETQTTLGRLYNSAIGSSGDGSLFVLGESGLSPVQNLVQYNPIDDLFAEVTPRESFQSATMNLDGSKIVINNRNIYNNSFSLIGQLSGLTKTVIDRSGDFVIGSDSSNNLYWYDTSNLTGQVLSADYSAAITESIGTINSLVLSQDGLTLFVLGSNRLLIIPVWQIIEDSIGSSDVCPSAGCGDIQIALGVTPGNSTPVIPPFDNDPSPLNDISPIYAGEGNQFEVLLTGEGFGPSSVVQFGNVLAENIRYINDTEMRATIPSLSAGTYTVTVDGHQLEAPSFRVIAQNSITPDSWAIGGFSRELLYNAFNHSIYNLDTTGSVITKIDLSDNTSINQSVANIRDLTWCPKDGYLYVATGSELRRYDPDTLAFIETISLDISSPFGNYLDSIECVAKGSLLFAGENQWQYYYLYNPESGDIFSSQVSGSNALVYSPTIDGVSSKGDRVIFGESGISSPDRVLFTPHLTTSTLIDSGGGFITSSWSDDGSLGVINNRDVYNYSISLLGTLDVGDTISASVVVPNGDKIFVVTDDAVIHKIVFNEAMPSNLNSSETYNLTTSIGTVRRAEVSLDGNTLFVSGTNGIESIDVSD